MKSLTSGKNDSGSCCNLAIAISRIVIIIASFSRLYFNTIITGDRPYCSIQEW